MKNASHPVGDRDIPLEADPADIIREGGVVGHPAKVSPVAGGDLFDLRDKSGIVSGMIHRYGILVGYEVTIDDHAFLGTKKDFYVGREVLEDIEPPSAQSASIASALVHWDKPRTYWGEFTDGLELFCFELASATDRAFPIATCKGWEFAVPDGMSWTTVCCPASVHGNVWTMGTAVFPAGPNAYEGEVEAINDHWGRVFVWSEMIAEDMLEQDFKWQAALKSIQMRAEATRLIVQPLFEKTIERVVSVAHRVYPDLTDPGPVSIGVSNIRLTPGTVGLTEPPTDRRPYTVVSISPKAFKTMNYLQQVVLHETIHIVLQSKGGDPHGERFQNLAVKLGLEAKYRD